MEMLFALFGGLAMFLYGMDRMSRALQRAAGDAMKRLLARLTATPLLYADSMQAVDTFLGNEMMWAIVPLAAARALAQEGRARICYLTDPAPDRVSYLMTRRGEALSEAAQLLLEDIRTEIQRIEGVHMVQ